MAAEGRVGTVGAIRAAFDIEKRPYVRAFMALALLTLIEIQVPGLTFLAKQIQIAFLVAFAITKASIVAAYYMHLRYEPRVLAYIPLVPIVLLAGLVISITLR